MYQPGAPECRPGPRTSAGLGPRHLVFSVLFLLLFLPQLGSHHQLSKGPLSYVHIFGWDPGSPQGEVVVVVVRKEWWRLCGRVALDPMDPQWSCCRDFYPFHRPTQRCCQIFSTGGFFVIPKDTKKSEAEDCKAYINTPRDPSV